MYHSIGINLVSSVRQGENLLPLLFNLFLIDLENFMDVNRCSEIDLENVRDDLYVCMQTTPLFLV